MNDTENLNGLIKLLSKKLDMITLPEDKDEAMALAKDLDVLKEARHILKNNQDDLRLTYNDQVLVSEARKTPYWKWEDVYTSASDADTEKGKQKLLLIAGILYDVYLERGYDDPTQKENLQAVQPTRVSIFRWFVQKLLRQK